MIKDSKGKKISREELTEIYKEYVFGVRNDDYGKYLTYDGDDEDTIDSVNQVNRKRSPKDNYGNYTQQYLDFLQQEAYKLAGNRKFARVMRLTFDPNFYAESKQPYLSMPFGEWLGYYELGNEYGTYGKKTLDKEYNDKVERFAQAYKIKIPESKNDMKEEFKKGGKVTWRNKYNKKYGFDKDESHSLKDISKKSGVSMKGLQQIYNKGIGAYKTNPSSVRPNVTSKEQWAMARVYSSVMGGKASKVDAKELKMSRGGKLRKPRNTSGIKFENGKYYNQYGQEYEIDWDVYDKIKDKVINPTFEALRIKKMVKGGNVSSIAYEDWKKASIYLNNEVNEKSSILQPYNFRDENVRMSEEYQKVKKDYDKSFKKLQDFNKVSPKQYQKRYRDEKRASWRMVKGGNVRTREQVISDINKLNEQNRSGNISHSMYYKAYEKLRKEAESLKPYK